MNIYLLTQTENEDYDTYDSCVVYADSEDEARNIHPPIGNWDDRYRTWASSPENVRATLIGYADNQAEEGVILGSFNAG